MKTALTNGLVAELNEAKARLAELQDVTKKVAKRSKRIAKAELRVQRVLSAMKAIVVSNAKAKADAKAEAKRQARLARKGRLQLKTVASQRKARALLRTLTEMAEVEVPLFLNEIKVTLGFKTAVGPRPAVKAFSVSKDGNRMNIQFFAASKKPNRKTKADNKNRKTKHRVDFEKAVHKDVKARGNKQSGPKAASFNLSASEYTLGYFRDGKQTLIQGEKHEVRAAIRGMLELKGTNQYLRSDVTPFIYVRGFEKEEFMNEQERIMTKYVSLTDVRNSRLQEGTLVQRNSESHLIRDLCEMKEFTIEAMEPGMAENIVETKVNAYDNTAQLNFKIVPVVNQLVQWFTKTFKKAFSVSVFEQIEIIQAFVSNGIVLHNGKEFVLYTLNSASPAQTRKGEAAFYEYARSNRNDVLAKLHNHDLRAKAVYSRFSASFDLPVYGGSKDGIWKFKMDKDPKRLDMAASGSRRSNMYSALFGEMEIIKEQKYKNGVGGEETITILQSVNTMLNGRKRRIVIIGDMVRFAQDHAIVVRRNENVEATPELVEDDFVFEKNMTDGGILLSDEVTYYLKAEGNLQDEGQSVQARGANGLKPFSYGVYKLREMTGADMVFMDGALKLDVLPSLLDGTFSLSVVQGSRLEQEEDVALVATQALLAMDVPRRNLKMLTTISTAYVKSAIHDEERAQKLLNIASESEDDSSEEDVEEVDQNVEIDMTDAGVLNVLRHAPSAFKDMAIKKKVANLMAKPLEKIKMGNILVKEAKMRHMGFDIFMVVKAVQGLIDDVFAGVEMPTVKYVDSIPAGCAIVVDAEGNLRTGYFLAVRYPILKKEEVRKVLAIDTLLTEEATIYYRDAARNGFFKGLVLFNSVDMLTESMSGADFDGDTCLVIFNSYIVNNFKNAVKMLDFYIDDEGKLQGGCPWADPTEAPDVRKVLGSFLDDKDIFVEQEVVNGKRTWTLKFKAEDVTSNDEAVKRDIYYVFNRMAAAHITSTAKESSIGSWTNHLMNLEEVLLTMGAELTYLQANCIEQSKLLTPEGDTKAYELYEAHKALLVEFDQYEALAKWLVCVVRWAIDEAKHGGAFAKPLDHIIAPFDHEKLPTPEQLLFYAQNKDVFYPVRMFV